jgi:hypothetical protein
MNARQSRVCVNLRGKVYAPEEHNHERSVRSSETNERCDMIEPAILDDHPDFSLVLGGPVFKFLQRARLSGEGLELVRRRILVITCIAWVPLLLLSAYGGHALGGSIQVPFLYDIEAHVRFLVALPILIAAELVVDQRIRPVVRQFVERRIVVPEEVPEFNSAIGSTRRVRNSAIVEAVMLLLVYSLGLWVWRSQNALGAASWYAIPEGGQLHLTLAGYWYVFVSLPIFQFILLRWYLRFFLWFRFLWQVSKLSLRLIPTHPDRAAGLGFLGTSTYAFGPILFAQGALLAGLIASQIFYAGQNLLSFKMEVAGFVAFFIVIILSPLFVFTRHLVRTKRRGQRDYGRLANRYVQKFDEKWVDGGTSADDELLGSADIQSLADLGNSYTVIQEMRLVPFGLKEVAKLAAATVAPLVPLTLTIFSLEELVGHLIKVLF